jgi:hypothetical protein
MRRTVLYGLIIFLGVLASALAGAVRRDRSHTNDFIVLFPIELLVVFLGGVAAGGYLVARRDHARGLLGVGLYLLLVAVAISTVFPLWLPTDDTILGSALLAGVLAVVGAGLALACGATLAGWAQARVDAAGLAGGVLAFLGVTSGGMVYPLFQIRVPLLVVALVGVSVLALAWRQRRLVVRPLLLAIAGAAGTLVVLLARGPGDWASASTSVKLYSFPLVVLAFGVSLVILATVPPGLPPPTRQQRVR